MATRQKHAHDSHQMATVTGLSYNTASCVQQAALRWVVVRGGGGMMDVDSRLPQLAMFMYSCIEKVKIRRHNPSRLFLNTRQRSPPPAVR